MTRTAREQAIGPNRSPGSDGLIAPLTEVVALDAEGLGDQRLCVTAWVAAGCPLKAILDAS